MSSNPQLPLGLVLQDSARFDSYFPGLNREAVLHLQQAASGEGEKLIYVAGTGGMGKTHLLQAACHRAGQCDRTSTYLPLQDLLELAPTILEDLEQLDLICLDDVAAIAGDATWENGVFDLFNRVRTAGGTLLVAGEKRPDQSGFALPDLVSRLGWGVTYTLKPLADDDVIASLACRAQGRGLELPEDTAQFMLRRFPRDLPTLFALFDTLDTASLIEQRRLTIPFVKSVLDSKT
ncbi:MAG TPA: DnaA regulatory inactivator Hda [Gammaproteobacteria bacterium]|nr:DnaA regulatory inactivator Hda [Gammaproteobacteria bacterium]